MSYTVSVRDTVELEKRLKRGEGINLPEECHRNARIIYTLLQYVERVLPTFKDLSREEVKRIAEATAYMIRPDTLVEGDCTQVLLSSVVFVPPFLSQKKYQKSFGEDGIEVHLMNNPDELNEGWWAFWHNNYGGENDRYAARAGEFFRCYWAIIQWMPGIADKLGKHPLCSSHDHAIKLADVMAFLLNPNDLDDYSYAHEEKTTYQKRLIKQMKEI